MKAEKICGNCTHYYGSEFRGRCEEHDGHFEPRHTCPDYKPDWMLVCGICGAEARLGEESWVWSCSEVPTHMISAWDGEWWDAGGGVV